MAIFWVLVLAHSIGIRKCVLWTREEATIRLMFCWTYSHINFIQLPCVPSKILQIASSNNLHCPQIYYIIGGLLYNNPHVVYPSFNNSQNGVENARWYVVTMAITRSLTQNMECQHVGFGMRRHSRVCIHVRSRMYYGTVHTFAWGQSGQGHESVSLDYWYLSKSEWFSYHGITPHKS